MREAKIKTEINIKKCATRVNLKHKKVSTQLFWAVKKCEKIEIFFFEDPEIVLRSNL